MNPTLWLTKARPYLRARALWAALFALVALMVRLGGPAPPPRDAEGVAGMLGSAVGGEVRPDDFVWEARGGFWSDAFLGRRVLFLARRPGSAEADLYRARVRLTRAGQPMGLRLVRNLSRSPRGDDRELIALGHRAAYMTSAFGGVQGITLLDLGGEGPARKADGWTARAAAAAESWLDTGSADGIGRIEITFDTPPGEAHHELQGENLVMALGKEAQAAALDTRDGSLNTGTSNPFSAAAQRIPHRAPKLGDLAVLAARQAFGNAAAGGLRSLLESIDRATQRLRPTKRAPRDEPPIRGGTPGPSAPPGEDGWPPAALSPVVQPALPGEGVWTAGARDETPASEVTPAPGEATPAPEEPPWAFETTIRPDPRRPEAAVRLFAVDTRQIDLQLAAGVDAPRSAVGLHGSGRLPEGTPGERVVAAFAAGPAMAAPATDREEREARGEPGNEAPLGFVATRRVLVPPSPGLSSVAIAGDGRVHMGIWTGPSDAPVAFTSLFQTPDALLGLTGPARRPLVDADAPLERSALGMTRSGQLVYAWSAQAPAETLARALGLAGCDFAVPLAAAPAPVGFVYLGRASSAPAPPGMSLTALALADRASSPMLYAMRRAAGPPPLAAGSFVPDGGRQPSPAWQPAIHAATVTSLGAQVHLTTFAPGRLLFRLRPGPKEPATKAVAALPTSLPEGEAPRVVATLGLAAGRRRGARGLIVDGVVGLPFRGEGAGALVLDRGRPKILRASEVSPGAALDATELPLTADEGKLRPEAREVGTMRPRAGACALDDGTLVVASTTFDSDEAATTALLDLGCARVVALDRGSHQAAFLHRAGTPQASEGRSEATTLYALEVPLQGRAMPLASPAR